MTLLPKTQTLALHHLTLSLFRSHAAARLDLTRNRQAAQMVVLTGPNGAGKTNVLEAISLLTPGRGLRHAEGSEITTRATHGLEGWAVAALCERPDGQQVRLGTGLDVKSGRRRTRIDGADAKGSNALAEVLSAVWLTPQMDRLFAEGISARRRFFDRLVFAYAPDHAPRLNRFEKLQRERLAVLTGEMRAPDEGWLRALESQIAGEAVAIAAARLTVAERLREHTEILQQRQGLFPVPDIAVRGAAEDMLMTMPAVDAEEKYALSLAQSRGEDRASGRTLYGVHRSDLVVRYAAKDIAADQASTGEQKALLLSLIIAHADMMRAEKGFVPLLLLDEVAAHLDDVRREQLFDILLGLGAQVFLTGTENAIFNSLEGTALFFDVPSAPTPPKRRDGAEPKRGLHVA